jgi:hypothetical protein
MTRFRFLLAAAASLALSGCDLANSEYLRPIVELPAFFRGSAPAAPTPTAEEPTPHARSDAAWWSQFGSADLDRLIAQAQDRNFDLAAAEARIRQAMAQQDISAAPLFPSLDIASNATRQQTAPTASTSRTGSVARPVWSNRFNMQFEASYEIDFWGKNRAAADAAGATLQARRFDLATVALTTEANGSTMRASRWPTPKTFWPPSARARRRARPASSTSPRKSASSKASARRSRASSASSPSNTTRSACCSARRSVRATRPCRSPTCACPWSRQAYRRNCCVGARI